MIDPAEDFELNDDEGWVDSGFAGGHEENWSEIDKEMFSADWIASMEALDAMPLIDLTELGPDGFICVQWTSTQGLINETLASLGFTDAKLLIQRGDELLMTAQVLAHLGLEVTQAQMEWHRRNLAQRIQIIMDQEPLAKRTRGEHLSPCLQHMRDIQLVEAQRASARSNPVTTGSLPSSTENWMVPGPGKRGNARRDVAEVDVVTRASLEKLQQMKWSKEVLGILGRANSPLTTWASDATDPNGILLGAVGATRGSTMESYTKTIKVFLVWLETAFRQHWPDSLIKVVEFLHTAGSKPCSPTFPSKFVAALAWFEKVGGWAQAERLTTQELVKRTAAYWTDALRDGVSPLKQAPRLPWMVLASIELYVVNDSHPLARRIKAWTMGVKSWATLREDDSQHISAKKLRQSGELLITELMRSKTSGTAKRTRQLPVAIWLSCSITRTLWLEKGLGLARDAGAAGNDFLLPRFGNDGAPMKEPMSYQESAALSKTVLSDLRVPTYSCDKGEWEESDEQLIPHELATYWTEHSPRSVIPSSAQALSVSKDERNFLGRWSPGGADEYGRAYRVIVQGIQRQVLRAVLSADKRLAENDIIDRIDRWGEDRGYPSGKIELLKQCLVQCMNDFWKQIEKAGGPPEDDAILPVPSQIQIVASTAPAPVSNKGKYLVVYSRNRKTAKLHRVGGCAWTSVTLADCQEVVRLSDCLYNTRCKLCWPELAKRLDNLSGDSSGSEM